MFSVQILSSIPSRIYGRQSVKMGKPRVGQHSYRRTPYAQLTRSLDDHSHPTCSERRQQEQIDPSDDSRSSSQAYRRGTETSQCAITNNHNSNTILTASNPGSGSWPSTTGHAQTRRQHPILHLTLSPNTRDDRGHPILANLVGRPNRALTLSKTHHQSLRGATSTRTGFRKLPAVF